MDDAARPVRVTGSTSARTVPRPTWRGRVATIARAVATLAVVASVATGCTEFERSRRQTHDTQPGTDRGSAEAPADGAVDGAVNAVPAPAPTGATVVRVVDGDTVVVEITGRQERVRLIGIDSPESVQPDHPVECYGPEASARLTELLPAGTAVTLLGDAETRDDYGRLLAYVFRAADDQFVNLTLAAEGFAVAVAIAPNVTFADDFSAAVSAAQRAGLGLWSACPAPSGSSGSRR